MSKFDNIIGIRILAIRVNMWKTNNTTNYW